MVDFNNYLHGCTKPTVLGGKCLIFFKNSLIFGDNITDLGMELPVKSQNIISIGFLNIEHEDLVEKYMDKFDIVIKGEGDFVLHDYLLRYIANVPQIDTFRDIMENNAIYREFLKIFV
jgi:hypothetical protein